MPGDDRRDHIRPLTSLRFLAALWVLLHHALPRGAPGSFTDALGSSGWLGVSLFFVLSGFLLTVRYAPAGKLARTTRDFWMERVARLAPTYLLALVFALPLFLRDARVQALAGDQVARITVAVLSLQQSWRPELACQWDCPAWSLSVEAWFYLAFPLVLLIIGRWLMEDPRRRRVRGGMVLGASLLFAVMIFPGLTRAGASWPLPVYTLSPLARWPEFLAGIGLAALLIDWRPADPKPGVLLFGAGIGWLAMAVEARASFEAAGLHLLPVSLPAFALLVAGAWALREHVALGLDGRRLVLFGEASYALYLFHAPLHGYVLAVVNRVVGRGYDSSWILFAGYLVLAVGLSVLVHLRFELPWRRRLRERWGLRSGRK